MGQTPEDGCDVVKCEGSRARLSGFTSIFYHLELRDLEYVTVLFLDPRMWIIISISQAYREDEVKSCVDFITE